MAASHRATQLENVLRKVIRGKDDIIRLALVSVLARGHLLIEDVPGVGKTTLGQALARAIDCGFSGCSSPATCCLGRAWHFHLLCPRAAV